MPYDDRLWSVRVPDGRGEYVSFVEDIMRMATIQITIQLLMVFQGAATMGVDFLVYLLQVFVGVAAYWLIVRRTIGVDRVP